MIVTLAERKSRAIARLKAGFESARTSLAAYAATHGGRFVVFGSFARSDIHPDSDCDVMVDFPTIAARDARAAAEDILREHGLARRASRVRGVRGPDAAHPARRDRAAVSDAF